jgi:hypothetical protein
VFFSACSNDTTTPAQKPPPKLTVTITTVNPNGGTGEDVHIVYKAGALQFYQIVEKGEDEDIDQGVEWTLENAAGDLKTGTFLSSNGKLTVALDETAGKKIIVKALADEDEETFATYEVYVDADPRLGNIKSPTKSTWLLQVNGHLGGEAKLNSPGDWIDLEEGEEYVFSANYKVLIDNNNSGTPLGHLKFRVQSFIGGVALGTSDEGQLWWINGRFQEIQEDWPAYDATSAAPNLEDFAEENEVLSGAGAGWRYVEFTYKVPGKGHQFCPWAGSDHAGDFYTIEDDYAVTDRDGDEIDYFGTKAQVKEGLLKCKLQLIFKPSTKCYQIDDLQFYKKSDTTKTNLANWGWDEWSGGTLYDGNFYATPYVYMLTANGE